MASSKEARNFWLRVPLLNEGTVVKDNQRGFAYVQVDPSAIGQHVLSAFYSRSSVKETGSLFKRAIGVESVSQVIDVTPLLETHAEMMSQCRSTLEAMGPIGFLLIENILPLLAIDQVVKALAASKVEEARELVEQGGYALMSALSEMATSMVLKSEVHQAWDSATSVVSGHEKAVGSIYEGWTKAVLDLNATIKELEQIEAENEQALRKIEAGTVGWRERLHSGPVVKNALVFFEGEGTSIDDGFTARCCLYLPAESLTPEQMEDVECARMSLNECQTMLASEQAKWQEIRVTVNTILETRHKVRATLDKLDTATKALHKVEEQHHKDADLVPPCDAPEPWRSLTRAQYELGIANLRNGHWAPHLTAMRFNSTFDSLMQLANQTPNFNETTLRTLREVEKDLRSLEGRLIAESPVVEKTPTQPPITLQSSRIVVTAPDPVPEEQVETKAEPVSVFDPKRYDELYEILIAVSGLLTCTPMAKQGRTLRGLMEMAIELGHMKAEEVDIYATELEAKAKSETLNCEGDVETVKSLFQSERKNLWLRYKPASFRFYVLKLVLSAAPRAQEIASVLKLDAEQVRQAKNDHRQRKYDAFKSRGEKGREKKRKSSAA